MTIAQVLQCKKSKKKRKSSNQNTIQAHYTLPTNNVNVKSIANSWFMRHSVQYKDSEY